MLTGIRRWFGNDFKSQKQVEQDEAEGFEARNESRRARGMKPLERPKKKDSEEEKAEEE